MMNAKEYTIEDYIPHRDRMRLIDRIIEVSERGTQCLAVVSHQWPSYKDGKINNILLVELVAQCTNFYTSWKNSKNEEKVSQGLLVGIKKANITPRTIENGSELVIDVNFQNSATDLFIVSRGTVSFEDETIADITIQAVKMD